MTGLTGWQSFHETPPANRPIRTPAPGFVTSDTCRSCHPGSYESWHASYHRTMTQVANLQTILPSMDGLHFSIEGMDYRVEKDGATYSVRRRPSDAAAGADFDRPRRIVLLTGSHNMQFYWMETGNGRALEHFPYGWLVAQKAWAPLSDTFLSPPEFHPIDGTGDWNRGCIDCHTTEGRQLPLQRGAFDSRVTEFGIACEACHGDGKEHIERNRNPVRRYVEHLSGGADATIANPARMKAPASALVCGQCHSVWAFDSSTAREAWTKSGAVYRPGEPALPERFIVQPANPDHAERKKAILAANPHFYEDSFWPDGMVRVVGREYNAVASSPCFKGGEFSCLSCHEMHPEGSDAARLAKWTANQLKTDGESDAACLQCHEKIGARLEAHTHHAASSVGSRCYDCHMPHSSFGLLRAVRSHQVSSPSAAESAKLGRPNACNLCHLDKTLEWTAEKLRDWYRQPIPALAMEDRKVAASVAWLVKGDAGQRALAAWSMGWAPAQKASGRDWLAPYLIVTLVDPYAAVRFVAEKSLQTLPGYADRALPIDQNRVERKAVSARWYEEWTKRARAKNANYPPFSGLGPDGRFDLSVYEWLLSERDNRFVFLVE